MIEGRVGSRDGRVGVVEARVGDEDRRPKLVEGRVRSAESAVRSIEEGVRFEDGRVRSEEGAVETSEGGVAVVDRRVFNIDGWVRAEDGRAGSEDGPVGEEKVGVGCQEGGVASVEVAGRRGGLGTRRAMAVTGSSLARRLAPGPVGSAGRCRGRGAIRRPGGDAPGTRLFAQILAFPCSAGSQKGSSAVANGALCGGRACSRFEVGRSGRAHHSQSGNSI